MEKKLKKVFGIGLSKTGTTSLTEALSILGFSSIHFPSLTDFFKIVEENDAVTDTPVSMHYKTLYEIYPESKFILTVRELKKWVLSAKTEFENRSDVSIEIKNLRKVIYSSELWDEEKYTNSYIQFNEEVVHFFSDKKGKLLVLDIFSGSAWEPICNFLELPIPKSPFPHLNRTEEAKFMLVDPEGK